MAELKSPTRISIRPVAKCSRKGDSMSIFEYDKEKEEAKLRKAEREYWYEEGIEQGLEQGLEQGILAHIHLALKYNQSIDTIIKDASEEFNISVDKVRELWNNSSSGE